MKKLPMSFYLRSDVVQVAKDLLGKILVTNFDDQFTSGRIVETEAYEGVLDRASHAYKGLTRRTKVIFGEGGTAYVYLCYGIHQMFNIVTSKAGEAHAILVRAVEPVEGVDIMLRRTGKSVLSPDLTSGPGKVGKAFGFHTSHCGIPMNSEEIYIADDGYKITADQIISTTRIGVDYAGEHAEWHYRFLVKDNKYVSRYPGK